MNTLSVVTLICKENENKLYKVFISHRNEQIGKQLIILNDTHIIISFKLMKVYT